MNKRPFLSTALWALLILALCGMPGKSVPHFSFLELISFDKFVHASIFFVLVVFFIRSNKLVKMKFLNKDAIFIAAGISIGYGGLTEILQATVFTDRSADVLDFIADSAGCLIAAILYRPISKKIPKLHLPL